MNRHTIFKPLIIFIVVGSVFTAIFIGCREKSPDRDANRPSVGETQPFPPGPSKVTTLKVVLQGPFAVVVRRDRDQENRILAYVPYDDDKMHQFYYPYPETPQPGRDFRFELSDKGLRKPERPPYVDRGFSDFNVNVPKGKPDIQGAYITLDLPAPDIISFIPPPEGVLFEPATPGGLAKFGRIPNNHILEYRVTDAKQITMKSLDSGKELPPISCADLRKRYGGGYQEGGGGDGNQGGSYIDKELLSCSQSVTYFLGVGLSGHLTGPDLQRHVIDFFNNKLLPSLFGFGKDDVPKGLRLARVDVDPSQRLSYTTASFTPAALQYPLFSPPRLIEVGTQSTSGSNCMVSATGHTSPPPPN